MAQGPALVRAARRPLGPATDPRERWPDEPRGDGWEVPDLADVRGQHHARWALEVALAGCHNLLLMGSPSAGKTLLARTVAGLLPGLTEAEAREVAVIRSDTVFVVGDDIEPYTRESSAALACDDWVRAVVFEPRSPREPPDEEFTLYRRRTYGEAPEGPFTFVPCRPYRAGGHGFARPAITLERRWIEPGLSQGAKATPASAPAGVTTRIAIERQGPRDAIPRGQHAKEEAMPDQPLLSTRTPTILVKLGPWTPHDDRELPRVGYGYRPGMSPQELYTSARVWWRLDVDRASRYRYAAAVGDGIVVGVWAIDPAGWRRWVDPTVGTSTVRWAFTGLPAERGVEDAYLGHLVPRHRPDGRGTFGSGSPVAYWPA